MIKRFCKKFVLISIMILICSSSVFATSNEIVDGKKESDDGIFNWASREDRMSSDGSFDYSFYQGLASDKFTLTNSYTTIYCNSTYEGTTFTPAFLISLYEKAYRNWSYHYVGEKSMSLNGSDRAQFNNLHYIDGKYFFRMDTDLTRGVDSPIHGYGEISNFGDRI